MGELFRRFLLSLAKELCPPLYRWIKRYFAERQEYKFVLRKSDPMLGFFRQETGTVVLNLAGIAACAEAYNASLEEYVVEVIEHEELHRVLYRIGAQWEMIQWYEQTYGGIPYPETLLKIEERLVELVSREKEGWCGGERHLHVPLPKLNKPPRLAWMRIIDLVDDEGNEARDSLEERINEFMNVYEDHYI